MVSVRCSTPILENAKVVSYQHLAMIDITRSNSPSNNQRGSIHLP